MQTILHAYSFDIDKPKDAAAYEALRAELSKGPHCMHSLSKHYQTGLGLDGAAVELETEHLFDNQWNTAAARGGENCLRVFDWAEDALFDSYGREVKNHKRGYWLEQTAEMREVRRNTMKCGYCGKQEPAAKGYVFCPHCIDSEHLTEERLHMTRMRPIDESGVTSKSTPLTEAEREHLMPIWREAQLHGVTERGKARHAKARRDVQAKYEKAISSATTEHAGFMWLLDHGIRTDNCIYYSHTDKFCFGWREPYTGALLSDLLDVISEFPFDYDLKKTK